MILFLIFIVVFAIIYFFNRPIKFQCPKCGEIQKSYTIINQESENIMTNGRRTISGKLDRRYNTQFEEKITLNYGVTCHKCGLSYKSNSNCQFDYVKRIYKAEGNESEWLGRLRKANSKLADIWVDYDDKLSKSMWQQKRSLEKLGLDASHVDAMIKKYGLKEVE